MAKLPNVNRQNVIQVRHNIHEPFLWVIFRAEPSSRRAEPSNRQADSCGLLARTSHASTILICFCGVCASGSMGLRKRMSDARPEPKLVECKCGSSQCAGWVSISTKRRHTASGPFLLHVAGSDDHGPTLELPISTASAASFAQLPLPQMQSLQGHLQPASVSHTPVHPEQDGTVSDCDDTDHDSAEDSSTSELDEEDEDEDEVEDDTKAETHLNDVDCSLPLYPQGPSLEFGIASLLSFSQSAHLGRDHSAALFQLVKLLLPRHNSLVTHASAVAIYRRKLDKQCPRVRLDVCVADCILFYNSRRRPDYQYASLDRCPVCCEPRFDANRRPRKVALVFTHARTYSYPG